MREAAKRYGVEALITDDYLEVEAQIAELQPELVLGTQMERHIAKRLGIPCAVISAPVHVQDFPARYSPQMGFEGANVHLRHLGASADDGPRGASAGMFRDDFEFHDGAGAVASRRAACRRRPPTPTGSAIAASGDRGRPGPPRPRRSCSKIPFFVRGKARRNTERFANERGVATITVETLYDAKAHFAPLTRRPVRVVVVTMDSHLAGAAARARSVAAARSPGPGTRRSTPPTSGAATTRRWPRCHADIARGDIVIATMLFLEDHIRAVLPALAARRDALRRDGLLHVGRRGRQADPARPVRHGGRGDAARSRC